MPTYEYVCEACKHEWELEQRMSEDPIKKCPSCNKPKAKRMITQGNFILKGGGWYADLYSSTGKKKATSGSGESGGGSGSSSSSGSSGSAGGSDKKSSGAAAAE